MKKLAAILRDVPEEDLIATGFTPEESDSIVSSFYEEEALIDDDETVNDGVVSETRNRTAQEVSEIVSRSVKVQFGMFTKDIPTEQYQAWVEGLKAASTQGDSPIALGAVVAQRVGLNLAAEEAEPKETEATELVEA